MYLDNKEFLEAILEYKKLCGEAEQKGREVPRPSDYIGRCIVSIAEGVASRPNFSGYTYLDEMKSDGILNAIKALRNFDPEKSKNPHAYFTQIVWYAFLQRIEREKKESAKKHKSLKEYYFDMILDPNMEHHVKDIIDDEEAREYEEKYGGKKGRSNK